MFPPAVAPTKAPTGPATSAPRAVPASVPAVSPATAASLSLYSPAEVLLAAYLAVSTPALTTPVATTAGARPRENLFRTLPAKRFPNLFASTALPASSASAATRSTTERIKPLPFSFFSVIGLSFPFKNGIPHGSVFGKGMGPGLILPFGAGNISRLNINKGRKNNYRRRTAK